MDDDTPVADAVCEGGDLDCGSGLLLIIRSAMAPLVPDGILEVRSREISVKEDLPAWCRMVGHSLISEASGEQGSTSYFIRKRGAALEADLSADLEQAREFRWSTRVRWEGGLRATVFARNHAIPVGQPASFDTEDVAPSAIELLLGALGSCLALGLQWRASRLGIDVEDLEVSLSASSGNILVFLGVEDEGNPGLCDIKGTVYVRTSTDEAIMQELWRETLARSPLLATVASPVDVKIDLSQV